jgi:hypothetical protein
MEAARISETSVDNYFTRQYIPEDKSKFVVNVPHPKKKKTKVFVKQNTQFC